MEPVANVVAGEFAGIGRIELVLAGIGVPGGLGRHRALLFPVACAGGDAVDAGHEIDREYGLGRIAEGAHELRAFDLGGVDPADRRTALVGEAFAEVHEDIALPGREGVSFDGRAAGGAHFGLDAARQIQRIVARGGHLVRILAAVDMIVHLERARSRHCQDGSEIGAADAGEVDVREAGEVLVFINIRRAPPAAVLVPGVELRAHHIERRNTHHAVRRHRPGVARPEVRRPDERIDAVDRLLGGEKSFEEHTQQGREAPFDDSKHLHP